MFAQGRLIIALDSKTHVFGLEVVVVQNSGSFAVAASFVATSIALLLSLTVGRRFMSFCDMRGFSG